MEKVADIFEEVANSPSATFKALLQKLRKTLQNEADKESLLTAIWRGVLDQCILCPKKERTVDKIVQFLTNFIVSSVSSGEADDTVVVSGISHLLQRSRALDKNVRLRACQILGGILPKIEELTEDLTKNMTDVLMPRLRDKAPAVRVAAVKVIEFLQFPQDSADQATLELQRLLTEDSSKEVRVAAAESICLTTTTLPLLIARVKDIKPEVRPL